MTNSELKTKFDESFRSNICCNADLLHKIHHLDRQVHQKSINGDVKDLLITWNTIFQKTFFDEMKSLFGWDPLPYVSLCHLFSQLHPPTRITYFLNAPLGNPSNDYSMIIFVQPYFLKQKRSQTLIHSYHYRRIKMNSWKNDLYLNEYL